MTTGKWRGVGTISLLVVLTALASCRRGLQTEAIEMAILQDLKTQGEITVVSIHCPRNVQPTVGEAFNCLGNLESESTFLVQVTPQDEEGTVEWEIPNSKGLLNLAMLETYFQEEIASELGIEPMIDCGGTYRVNRPGDSFECAVVEAIAPPEQADSASPADSADPASSTSQTEPADPVLVEVVVNVDQQGNVNWQQVRRARTAQATASANTDASTAAPATDSPPAPAADTASEAETAEDFLDGAGALDDF
jgi:hypothetical protein